MKRLLLTLPVLWAAFILLGAFVSPASADTISFSASIPAQTTDFTNVPLQLSQFNPSLGTLTQVDLALTTTVNTSFTIWTNGNSGTASLRVLSDVFSLSVTDSGGYITSPQIANVSLVTPNAYSQALGNYYKWSSPITTGVPVSTGIFTTTATDASSYGNGALLALLTGAGTTPLSVSTSTLTSLSYSVNSPGGLSEATNANLNATITYEYTPTPVPLPASLLMLAPGLLGLGIIRRKTKR